ncbi:hypothetical protein EDD15DRAFT_2281855 [Pisolithus albus]|nr:hypothetical protein EDD15DRAFT_2281855 [Pisolithus albus]
MEDVGSGDCTSVLLPIWLLWLACLSQRCLSRDYASSGGGGIRAQPITESCQRNVQIPCEDVARRLRSVLDPRMITLLRRMVNLVNGRLACRVIDRCSVRRSKGDSLRLSREELVKEFETAVRIVGVALIRTCLGNSTLGLHRRSLPRPRVPGD